MVSTPVFLFLDSGADCGIVGAGSLSRLFQKPLSEIALNPPRVASLTGLSRDGPCNPMTSVGSITLTVEVAYGRIDKSTRGVEQIVHLMVRPHMSYT